MPRKAKPETLLKRAVDARLAINGHLCDGCHNPIGRYTKSCSYRRDFDRVYCSACTRALDEAEHCSYCGTHINAFEEVTRFSSKGPVCAACVAPNAKYEVFEASTNWFQARLPLKSGKFLVYSAMSDQGKVSEIVKRLNKKRT